MWCLLLPTEVSKNRARDLHVRPAGRDPILDSLEGPSLCAGVPRIGVVNGQKYVHEIY